jgi:tight adherence protein C
MYFIIEALTFCIVVAMTFAVTGEFERVVVQRRRLGERDFASRSPTGSLLNQRTLNNRFFQWIQASTSISDPDARQKLQTELSVAGFEHPAAPVWYVISRFLLAIGLPAAFLLIEAMSPKPITGFFLVFWALILCVVGLIFPAVFVSRRAKARRLRLQYEFPDALDLMVVCVEAGLSMDATFVRVRQEIRESHPLIARQFSHVSDELHAGRSRADALRAMADRTEVAGIKSFVTLVIQTEALGASIAQTLRTYSTEMRETRFIKAEEKAMRIPVLMTIPLVACMLPVIVAAVMLPVIIDVIRIIIPALTAHHGGG